MKLAVRYFLCFVAVFTVMSSDVVAEMLTTWGTGAEPASQIATSQVERVSENKFRKNWASSQKTTLGQNLDGKGVGGFDAPSLAVSPVSPAVSYNTPVAPQLPTISAPSYGGYNAPSLAVSPTTSVSPVTTSQVENIGEGKFRKKWSSLKGTVLGKASDDKDMSGFDAPYSSTSSVSPVLNNIPARVNSPALRRLPTISNAAPLRPVPSTYASTPTRKVSLPVDMEMPMVGQVGMSDFGVSESSMSNSVEIFDLGASSNDAPTFPSQMGMQQTTMPNYGGGIQSSDSSVTVFDVGTDMASQNSYGGNSYQSNSYGNNMNGGFQSGAMGNSAVAGQIFFKHGSSRLGSGDKRKIGNMADQAKFAPVNYITVEGFASRPTQAGTDNAQAHIINLRQSMKRSEKVSKELVKKGVPGEKIKTVSWGASKSTGNDAQDRRVDVVMGEK